VHYPFVSCWHSDPVGRHILRWSANTGRHFPRACCVHRCARIGQHRYRSNTEDSEAARTHARAPARPRAPHRDACCARCRPTKLSADFAPWTLRRAIRRRARNGVTVLTLSGLDRKLAGGDARAPHRSDLERETRRARLAGRFRATETHLDECQLALLARVISRSTERGIYRPTSRLTGGASCPSRRAYVRADTRACTGTHTHAGAYVAPCAIPCLFPQSGES